MALRPLRPSPLLLPRPVGSLVELQDRLAVHGYEVQLYVVASDAQDNEALFGHLRRHAEGPPEFGKKPANGASLALLDLLQPNGNEELQAEGGSRLLLQGLLGGRRPRTRGLLLLLLPLLLRVLLHAGGAWSTLLQALQREGGRRRRAGRRKRRQ